MAKKRKQPKQKPEQKDALLDNNPRFESMFGSLVKSFNENLEFIRAESKEDKAARAAKEREDRADSVSGEDSKDDTGDSLRSKMGNAVKGVKDGASKGLGMMKSIGGFLLKGMGIALITPMIIKFISGFVDGALTAVFGEEAADKYGGMIKVGSILAVIGGLLFGPMAILPLFFAGIMGYLGKKLVDGLDGEGLARLGIDKGTLGGVVAAVGAALGLFVPSLLKKAIIGTGKLALKMVKGGGSLAAKAIKSVGGAAVTALKKPKTVKAVKPAGSTKAPKVPVPKGKLPSGGNVGAAGKVSKAVSSKLVSAKGIANAMKLEGRMGQVAKYAKFFKFAGPAMAIVPALIDPLMAIYRGEDKKEITKQTVGALGTIGGAALGGLAGAALGTGIFPGVGSAIGGFVGLGLGAFMGESLTESIAEAVLSGSDISEDDAKKLNSGTRRRSSRGGSKGVNTRVEVASSSGTPPTPVGDSGAASIASDDLVDSEPVAKPIKTGGRSGRRNASKVDAMQEGTQAVLANTNNVNVAKGGDTMNNTSVGGNSTTYNIINGGGNSLANGGHLPVSQSA